MSKCAIKSCGLKKSDNHPKLTLHRLPRNEKLRNKWQDVIGKNNLNTKSKVVYICSMHFKDACFNKTLDVIRLHDGAIPSLHLPGGEISYAEPAGHTTTTDKAVETPDNDLKCCEEILAQKRRNVMALKRKCTEQQRKIKRLNEMLRRQRKKFAIFENTIKALQRKNTVSADNPLSLEECPGLQNVLKRLVSKSFKGS